MDSDDDLTGMGLTDNVTVDWDEHLVTITTKDGDRPVTKLFFGKGLAEKIGRALLTASGMETASQPSAATDHYKAARAALRRLERERRAYAIDAARELDVQTVARVAGQAEQVFQVVQLLTESHFEGER